MKISFICLKSQEKTYRLRSADYGLRVKRARNLLTGEVKILKWVFKERFNARIGGLVFECVRSPRKEARILELVRGRPEFMQGVTTLDSAGNQPRILDYIRGKTLGQHTLEMGKGHEEFFFDTEAEKVAWTGRKREETNKMLENYRQVLLQSGFPEDKVRIRSCVNENKALSEVILESQCGLSCCTIVVGRRRKSKTEEFLFGSTSSKLIHEAKNCAAWVVE